MENKATGIKGVKENETFFEKCKRYGKTAVNWGKTHWKGIALGAVALGGGAYMLSRRGDRDGDETGPVVRPAGGGVDYRDAIENCFAPGPEDDETGPEDDEPEME